jgi:hypothetical protein
MAKYRKVCVTNNNLIERPVHFICPQCKALYVNQTKINVNNYKPEIKSYSSNLEYTCEKCKCFCLPVDSNLSTNIRKLLKKNYNVFYCLDDFNVFINVMNFNEGYYKESSTINAYVIFKLEKNESLDNIKNIDFSKYKYWDITITNEVDGKNLNGVNIVKLYVCNKDKDRDESGRYPFYDMVDFNKGMFESIKHQYLCELNKVVKELCDIEKQRDPIKYKRPKLNRKKIEENKKRQREELRAKGLLPPKKTWNGYKGKKGNKKDAPKK